MSKQGATFLTFTFLFTQTAFAQPVRKFDDPGSPPFKVLKTGENPPLDVDGNYDTMSGMFADYIEAEVLPRVEKNCEVKLTKDPDGRAAMGNSSGGSAALIMAWYRTNLYHRVLTTSGTFVNQQWPFNPETPGGAWDFHETIIPNSPKKPLRVFISVGDRDLLNPNVMRDGMHDWVEANHRMAKVLKAKGYEYQVLVDFNLLAISAVMH